MAIPPPSRPIHSAEVEWDSEPVKTVLKKARQVPSSIPDPIKDFVLDTTCLQATNFAKIIQNSTLNYEFLELVSNTQENISFGGSRYITIPMLIGSFRVNGTAHIAVLAARVIKLVQEQKFEYSPEERNIGSLISRKIDQLYDANDRRLKKCNILTRLFCFLRNFPNRLSGSLTFSSRNVSLTRWNWGNRDGLLFHNIFDYYTKKQYERKFGSSPLHSLHNSGFEGQTESLWLPPRD
ncbi:MAG: hypothetical protein KR126chlam6_01145 [Candidatus Anoxychlamydiales bacterium]|nr:hypothetical protein [Candidatus Anoxychlamydiales bacterium]